MAEQSEPALYHATRSLSLCKEIGLQDWDLARSVPIEKKEDREPLESDLSTITISA